MQIQLSIFNDPWNEWFLMAAFSVFEDLQMFFLLSKHNKLMG